MTLRAGGLASVPAALLLTAAPAGAATLNVDKPCYQEREPVSLSGGPFTPNGLVRVSRDGFVFPTPLLADGAGMVSGRLTAPVIDPADERRFTLVAADGANPALTATATPLASKLSVTVRPGGGRPAVRRRIRARGFTEGGSLYAHIVRGSARRNVRIGALSGSCGRLETRRRIFRKKTKNGTYRVQFDTHRRFMRTTIPRVTFRVRIFTVFRPRTSAASASERWIPLD